MFTPGNVCVGQFVDQNHLWVPGDNGANVHLFENRAFVFDLFPRNRLQAGEEFLDAFAAMGLDDADHHVFPAAPAPLRLAQHTERFANTGSVAKEKLENAAGLLRGGGNFQPLFRFLWQETIFSPANRKPALE
jgi:hypothetical protein